MEEVVRVECNEPLRIEEEVRNTAWWQQDLGACRGRAPAFAGLWGIDRVKLRSDEIDDVVLAPVVLPTKNASHPFSTAGAGI
jgi:hypothetical protein